MLFPARIPIDDKFITAREAEVLWLSTNGLVTTSIAERLFVSPKTIARHRENIRNRFELTGYYALQQFALKIRPELEKWIK